MRSSILVFLASAAAFIVWGSFTTQRKAKADKKPKPVIKKSGPLRFRERLIMDKFTYPFGVGAADLDGDGDLDITAADALPNNSLYWYENKRGQFKKHWIQKNDPQRLERHQIGDINGDGKLDVVIVKNLFGEFLWFENSGAPADGKLWKRHVINKEKLPGAYDVALADFDGDGDLDVAASTWRLSNRFVWYENDGTPANGTWKAHLIEAKVAETRMIRAADIDGDGDMDLVGTARVQPLIVWYENTGKAKQWKKHVIDSTSLQPIHGQLVDIDKDGDVDLVMALGMTFTKDLKKEQVAWYENSGKPASGPWKKHIIATNFDGAFEAVAADLDGDKDLDVIATSWANRGQVVWFENQGDPKKKWSRHLIKDNWRRANQVITADINGDGRPDIIACAERGTLELRLWENMGK